MLSPERTLPFQTTIVIPIQFKLLGFLPLKRARLTLFRLRTLKYALERTLLFPFGSQSLGDLVGTHPQALRRGRRQKSFLAIFRRSASLLASILIPSTRR
jgi:hypothetical protein